MAIFLLSLLIIYIIIYYSEIKRGENKERRFSLWFTALILTIPFFYLSIFIYFPNEIKQLLGINAVLLVTFSLLLSFFVSRLISKLLYIEENNEINKNDKQKDVFYFLSHPTEALFLSLPQFSMLDSPSKMELLAIKSKKRLIPSFFTQYLMLFITTFLVFVGFNLCYLFVFGKWYISIYHSKQFFGFYLIASFAIILTLSMIGRNLFGYFSINEQNHENTATKDIFIFLSFITSLSIVFFIGIYTGDFINNTKIPYLKYLKYLKYIH